MISKSDIAKLKKSDAITHLTKLNLSTSGGRPELLKRLREHYHNNKERRLVNQLQKMSLNAIWEMVITYHQSLRFS